jgi:PAS domain S-box-containing protein
VGLGVFDREGRHVAANQRFADLADWPYDQLIGSGIREVIPGFADQLEGLLKKAFAEGYPQSPVYLKGYVLVEGARRLRRWKVELAPLLEDAELRYVVAAVSDVTETGDEDREARELHYLFQALIEQSADAIFVKDTENRYRYINPAGARLLGRRVDTVIGKDDFALFSRETAEKMWARDRFLMRGAGAPRTYDDEDEVDGRRLVFQTTKSPLRSVHGDVLGLIGISRDITRQREQEEERLALIEKLSQAKQQLEEERELRQKLVANLGHDLRSPLSIAKMASQFIGDGYSTPEAERTFLGRMRCALDRIDAMIRDLLDSSRAEAGHGWQLAKARMDLRSTLLDSLHELSIVYPERLRFAEIEAMPAAYGEWERSAIQRILENLVHNAIRHGDSQRPVTISGRIDQGSNEACFTVHNYGEPIRLSREDLFQRFRRDKTLKPGWGLGLTIVKSLVEVHGGYVDVESEEGKGTNFTVHLPLL